jgi:eukaryotic-like serine/threonine-protein kinase
MPPSDRAIRLGRYALHAAIASGGMASVHLGRLRGPVGFSRTVAIKRLHPPYAHDANFVTMFVDEAQLMARVQHPNVVPILDVVHEEGELFLVMEYVHGVSLARLAQPGRAATAAPVPAAVVAAVFADVLHGLHAAHEATTPLGEPLGLVHRDVTPQNILVGVDGTAKITDFGIAKATSRAHHTVAGILKGKLPYVAPEQLQAGEIGPWTDVYAASVSMWEALTGRTLFDADNEARIVEKVLLGATRVPSALAPDVPCELDDVVMRGLELKPHKRFQTAREMALALEAAVSRAPVSAVGTFVDERAGEELSERSTLLRAIESAPEESDVPPLVAEAPPPPKPRRRLLVIVGAAAALLLAVLLVLRARSADERTPSEPSAALSAFRDDDDLPPAAPEPSAMAPATASGAAPRAAPQRAPKKPCEPRGRDATGRIVYDRHCLSTDPRHAR